MDLFKEFINRLPNKELWNCNDFKANYLIIDIESTGFDFVKNRIVQLGYLYVKDGLGSLEQTRRRSIKTEYSPITWSAIYASRDDRSRQFMTMVRKAGCDLDKIKELIDANDGSIQGIDYIPESIRNMQNNNGRRLFTVPVDVTGIRSSQLMKDGVDRIDALKELLALLKYCENNKYPIIGHNIYSFDIPFIEYELKQFLNVDYKIDRELVLDTGAIVKGMQLKSKLGNNSFNEWYYKMSNRKSKIKWTLDDYCFDAFKLHKYGIDPTEQHRDAGYDCFVNDCLVRELLK